MSPTQMSPSPATRLRRCAILWSAAVLLSVAPALQAQTTYPDTPAGRRASALVETIRDGREERVRAFVAEYFTGRLLEIPLPTHVAQFRRMSADFGSGPPTAVHSPSADIVEVTFQGPRGPITLRVRVEDTPPHRIAGLGVPLGAAGPAPTGPLTDAARAAVVDSAATLLRRFYVSRDTAELIAVRLRERVRAGAYGAIDDRAALARALTADIQALHPDKHLVVNAMQPPQALPATGPVASATGQFGYLEARVLPGNVGYLKLNSFPPARAAFDELAAALRTLERTDATVIDLRGAKGGSRELANFLISHFTEPGLLLLASFEPATGDTTLQRTLSQVPGPRRLDVPLFVLVDNDSRSAAEAVPFVLRSLGRAVLVGGRTAGAGRNNVFLPVGQGLTISISVTRVWDPCTGKEWERVGVTPEIVVPSAEALDAALRASRNPAPRRAAQLPQAQCRRAAS